MRIVVTILLVARAVLSAQGPAQRAPTFAVASVKLNTSGSGEQMVRLAAGETASITNVPLRTIVQLAHGVPGRRIFGGPGWITDPFDIVAKTDAQATAAEMRLMLRALLRDRFRLVTHLEQREETAYTLVLARNDGRLGPSLRTSTTDCATPAGRAAQGAAGPAHPCNPRLGIESLGGRGLPISGLAGMLTGPAGGTVVDKTGLSGNFDWDLTFTRPGVPQGALDRERPPSIDSDSAVIFTAVQEQLGLRLEPSRALVDVLVIDSVERPTPD